MDYYDGNTVTALWNYAQHFMLNDNSYDTQFGPSTPGAINVVSGNTSGAVVLGGSTPWQVGTDIGDQDPDTTVRRRASRSGQCSNPTTPINPRRAGGAPSR